MVSCTIVDRSFPVKHLISAGIGALVCRAIILIMKASILEAA
jgi:hypothetical protein